MLRRIFLLVLVVLTALPVRAAMPSDLAIKVWEDNALGKGKVVLKPYIPSGTPTGRPAIIICPGGSYFWLAEENEGEKVAEALCERGIAAFVLTYRVAGKFNFITDFRPLFGGNRYPSMLEDAKRSIQIVKSMALSYGIDEHRIGMMGFSAGGHLAMLSEEIDNVSADDDGVSPKPDFVALIYPVVSLSDPEIVHRRSRRGILCGKSGNRSMRDSLSLEKNVPTDCCPVFLLHCEDDPVVNFNNAVALDSVLTSKGISHKFIRASRGGHGFGISEIEAGDRKFHWLDDFILWLRQAIPSAD